MALVFVSISGSAQGEEGEHTLALHGEYARFGTSGGGAGLFWEYGLSDFWNVYVDATWARRGGDEAAHRAGGAAGIVYNLDAFEWVPYVRVGLGGCADLTDAGDARGGFVVEAVTGVDWRPVRRFGVGAFGGYGLAVVGSADSVALAGVRVSAWY